MIVNDKLLDVADTVIELTKTGCTLKYVQDYGHPDKDGQINQLKQAGISGRWLVMKKGDKDVHKPSD